MDKVKVAIFASGNGSNAQAIMQAAHFGELNIQIEWVISDKPTAFVVERANKMNIPVWAYTHQSKGGRQLWEKEVCRLLQDSQVKYIFLAGYMKIIGKTLLECFPQKIMNIHPSLLPAFPGMHSIEKAYESGVKITGVTLHWIDQGVDTGPIIAQEAIMIQPEWSLEMLEQKIHEVEHRLYKQTIKQIIK